MWTCASTDVLPVLWRSLSPEHLHRRSSDCCFVFCGITNESHTSRLLRCSPQQNRTWKESAVFNQCCSSSYSVLLYILWTHSDLTIRSEIVIPSGGHERIYINMTKWGRVALCRRSHYYLSVGCYFFWWKCILICPKTYWSSSPWLLHNNLITITVCCHQVSAEVQAHSPSVCRASVKLPVRLGDAASHVLVFVFRGGIVISALHPMMPLS